MLTAVSKKAFVIKDIKALMADLKAVYAAVDEAAALDALDTFSQRWEKIPKDRPVLARELAQPEHLFQVPAGGMPPDLYDQRNRGF